MERNEWLIITTLLLGGLALTFRFFGWWGVSGFCCGLIPCSVLIFACHSLAAERRKLARWRRRLTTKDECMVRVDDRYDNRIILMPGHSLYRADVDINECWPVEE